MVYNTTLTINHATCYQGIFLASITGLAILLNLSVIISLLCNLKTLPPYMLLVLNLAISDISFAIVGFSIRSPGLYFHNFYKQNRVSVFLCKSTMFFYLPILVCINSTVLLLTYDRRCAIRTPLHRGLLRSKRRVYKAAALSWFLTLTVWSILIASVILGVAGDLYDARFGRCSLTSTNGGKILHFCMYFVFLMVPSMLTLFFYGQIVHTLLGYRRDVRSIRPFTRQSSRVFTNQELRHVEPRIKTKSFLTITIILIFYYLTLLPSFLLRDLPMIISLSLGYNILNLPPSVTVLASVAFYFSTLIDPIVYGVRSPHIFKTVKQVIWYINKDDVYEFECRITSNAAGSVVRSRNNTEVCPVSQSFNRRSNTSADSGGGMVRKGTECSDVSARLSRPTSFHLQLRGRKDPNHAGVMFQALLPLLSRVRTTRMRIARWNTF